MKIGDVAKITGVSVETIRYYERTGIITKPTKPDKGFRNYTNDIVTVVKFVKNAQKIGFSLEEIKELLSLKIDPTNDCGLVKIKALSKIEEIEIKITTLETMKKSLIELANRCSGKGKTSTCSILNALDSEELV